MALVTIPYRFVVKRDTAANFVAANTLLLQGEFGLEEDTGRMKMGDGVTPWNSLTTYQVPGPVNLTGLANGYTQVWEDGAQEWIVAPPGSGGVGAIGATFDGGGAVLVPGVFTDVLVPFNCTITSATVLADQTGSIVLSVLADPYASFPPTTNIAPTTPPTISADDKSQDVALSGWTTSISAGTVVRLGIVSCTSIERATLTLGITKL